MRINPATSAGTGTRDMAAIHINWCPASTSTLATGTDRVSPFSSCSWVESQSFGISAVWKADREGTGNCCATGCRSAIGKAGIATSPNSNSGHASEAGNGDCQSAIRPTTQTASTVASTISGCPGFWRCRIMPVTRWPLAYCVLRDARDARSCPKRGMVPAGFPDRQPKPCARP